MRKCSTEGIGKSQPIRSFIEDSIGLNMIVGVFIISLYHIEKRGGLFPWQGIIPRVLTSITFRTLERPFPYDAELIGEYKVLVIGKIVS